MSSEDGKCTSGVASLFEKKNVFVPETESEKIAYFRRGPRRWDVVCKRLLLVMS